jgi:hypothetical protein
LQTALYPKPLTRESVLGLFLFVKVLKEFVVKEKLKIVKKRGEPRCVGRARKIKLVLFHHRRRRNSFELFSI